MNTYIFTYMDIKSNLVYDSINKMPISLMHI